MANIVITGASGFVGRHLAAILRGRHHTVVEVPDPFQEFRFPDESVHLVYHQAAITDPQNPDRDTMLKVNHTDAIEFFRRAIDAGVPRIVYASSAAVYGDNPVPFVEDQAPRPLTPYAESKARLDESAAKLAEESGAAILGLRYSNVYGPGEGHKGKAASVVYQVCRQMRAGHRPRLFEHGEQLRDWVSVRDVMEANMSAGVGTPAAPSGVYNVGSGSSVSFNQVVEEVNKVLGTALAPEYIPNPFTGSYQSFTLLNLAKSRAVLQYDPFIDLEHGIRLTLASPD